MSRPIEPTTVARLQDSTLSPIVLVELEFASGPLRLWSGIGEVIWDGKVFHGSGKYGTIGPVEETEDVRATGTSLMLSGMPQEMVSLIWSDRWQNRPARIFLAYVNTENQRLDTPPIQVFSGRMDQMTWKEGDDITFVLTLESFLVDLERPRIRRYTSADQQGEYPGDKGFDYVPSLQEAALRWGTA